MKLLPFRPPPKDWRTDFKTPKLKALTNFWDKGLAQFVLQLSLADENETKRKQSGVTWFCLFQNITTAESRLPPVPAAEVLGAISDELISGANSSSFQAEWMVPPGDVSLVSEIATEQAVYPGQCWLMLGKTPLSQTTQPEPTTIKCNLEKEEAPHWFFFLIQCWLPGAASSWPSCWSIGCLWSPYLGGSSGHFPKFHLRTARGSGQQDYRR